jgi:hypothetical protein
MPRIAWFDFSSAIEARYGSLGIVHEHAFDEAGVRPDGARRKTR